METHRIEVIGYAVAAALMGLLTVLPLFRQRRGGAPPILFVATGASALWASVHAFPGAGSALVVGAEALRLLAWLAAALLLLLRVGVVSRRIVPLAPYLLALLAVAAAPVIDYALRSTGTGPDGPVAGFPLAVAIVVVAEQLLRNAPLDTRRSLGMTCLAIIGLFAYDAVTYLQYLSGLFPNAELLAARGYVSAMLAVPLGIGIWRGMPELSESERSRPIEPHAGALLVLGLLVGVTIGGRIYVSSFGGSWGDVGSILVVSAAIIIVSVLLISPSARRQLRVGLTKVFFAYKYDYRREWLRFIGTLSASAAEKVPTSAIRAVAQIVNSPGGVAWVQDEGGGAYRPIGSWRHEIGSEEAIAADSPLVRFLEDRQWVVNSQEMKKFPQRYEGLTSGDLAVAGGDWWLVVPMFLGKRLLGFITLQSPWSVPALNFEDHDLLRTAGRHVAMHINQAETDRRLAESQQFSAYNRLTAFLMHDFNNLIAQQSLVVKNAEKFRNDQRFVDDAIDTIANSVSRMRRLMDTLSGAGKVPARRRTDLEQVLQNVVTRCEGRRPVPRLVVNGGPIEVLADHERLTFVIEHLIRNAQDATREDGSIRVEVDQKNGLALVTIRDNGEGMTAEFIRERLFRPFDSTKGSQAMGIGACQARDYIRSIGGDLNVESTVGVGTSFSFTLPIHG